MRAEGQARAKAIEIARLENELAVSTAAGRRPLAAAGSGILGLLIGLRLAWLREANDDAIGSIRQLRQWRMAVVGWLSASFVSLASICAAAIDHHFRQP